MDPPPLLFQTLWGLGGIIGLDNTLGSFSALSFSHFSVWSLATVSIRQALIREKKIFKDWNREWVICPGRVPEGTGICSLNMSHFPLRSYCSWQLSLILNAAKEAKGRDVCKELMYFNAGRVFRNHLAQYSPWHPSPRDSFNITHLFWGRTTIRTLDAVLFTYNLSPTH